MKNHFIPCFYTKQWADDNGRITLYSRPNKRVIERSKFPSQVGYQEDLYTLPGIGDITRYDLETKFFCELDQRASYWLDKMKRGLVLSVVERESWATFIISLRQRNPQKMVEIAMQAKQIYEEETGKYRIEYELRRQKGERKSYDEYISELRAEGWFDRQNKLLVQTAILLPRSIATLISFEWSLIKLNTAMHHDLLTSDRPVIMTNGIAHAEGHVALPSGPKTLFIAAGTKETIQHVARVSDLGRSVNDKIVRQARAQVYGTTRLQLAFVQNRLGIAGR